MKDKVLMGVRLIIGLLMVVFGLNKFFHFVPMQPMPEGAMAFMGGLGSAVYFFPFLAISEIAIGISFLSNKYVNLALLILAPIAINMVGFHLSLAPAGGIPAYFVFLGGAFMGWSRLTEYKNVLKA